MMMKMNKHLNQAIFILSAVIGASFVMASNDNVADNQQQAGTPSPPPGPYHSQNSNNMMTPQSMQAPAWASMPPARPAWAQRPPMQQDQPNGLVQTQQKNFLAQRLV